MAKFDKTNLFKNTLIGLFLAVAVHGLYDFFLFQRYDNWLMILATFVLMGGLFFSRKFITRHQEDSPFNHPNLIEHFPDDKTRLNKKIKHQPSSLDYEDNEILSTVLYKMKEKESLEKEEEE